MIFSVEILHTFFEKIMNFLFDNLAQALHQKIFHNFNFAFLIYVIYANEPPEFKNYQLK